MLGRTKQNCYLMKCTFSATKVADEDNYIQHTSQYVPTKTAFEQLPSYSTFVVWMKILFSIVCHTSTHIFINDVNLRAGLQILSRKKKMEYTGILSSQIKDIQKDGEIRHPVKFCLTKCSKSFGVVNVSRAASYLVRVKYFIWWPELYCCSKRCFYGEVASLVIVKLKFSY